jgi:replicative DNA helicase
MPDVAAERKLPHSLDAEKSVLGAILIHNDAFNQAAEHIDGRDFFRDAHRRIFNSMVALSERSEPIDFVTLREELSRGGQLDEAERAIFAIAEDRIRAGFVPLRDLVQGSFAAIEKLQSHKGLVTGVPTGFVDLDEMTSGLQPSDLVLVAARPSMGKTSFVLNIAQHVGTSTDMTVGFFSLEMSKEQLFMRMLTSEARIDAHRFRSGYLSEKDYGRLSQALGTLAEARVFIDDTASIGVLEMRAKARRLKAEHGLHLLVIDYIQLMQGRGRFESRQAELASISRSLKGLAKELGVPIVALSQLSRAPETRSDHRPQLSDLRESGALEQDADVVMFIYRSEQYRTEDGQVNQEDQGTAEIIIGKQRNGPTGTAKLAFIKEFTRFENLAQGTP